MSSPIQPTPDECVHQIIEALQDPDLDSFKRNQLENQLDNLQPLGGKTKQTCMCNRTKDEGPSPTCLSRASKDPRDCCIWDTKLLKYNSHYDAFNELGTHYYRVTDRSTGGDYPRAEVIITAYPIDRMTTHWVWLKGRGPGHKWGDTNQIFKVGNKACRSFAHHSIAAALQSWQARKNSQLWHLRNKLDHVERAMELVAKTNWSPVEACKARYK